MNQEIWLDENPEKHYRLTETLVSVVRSILHAENIDFLAVTGRTKDKNSILEKIRRKNYKNIPEQLTDVSGVRIVVFIESAVPLVCEALKASFTIDEKKSNYDLRSPRPDYVGYRSAHIVAKIGRARAKMREFAGLEELNFEFQIRTILQHAWAELSHDRAYKFGSGLPYEITRKLNLHAGLLELADRGFAELVSEIGKYESDVADQYAKGNMDVDVNTITLRNFIKEWAQKNNFPLETTNIDIYSDLIRELRDYDVVTIGDLLGIIPSKYAEISEKHRYKTNIFGLVRDWMIINDPDKLIENVQPKWTVFDLSDEDEAVFYEDMLTPEEIRMLSKYSW